jgi:hypothetical protein
MARIQPSHSHRCLAFTANSNSYHPLDLFRCKLNREDCANRTSHPSLSVRAADWHLTQILLWMDRQPFPRWLRSFRSQFWKIDVRRMGHGDVRVDHASHWNTRFHPRRIRSIGYQRLAAGVSGGWPISKPHPQTRMPHISILRCGHSRHARTRYRKINLCRSGSSDTNKKATTISSPSVATDGWPTHSESTEHGCGWWLTHEKAPIPRVPHSCSLIA